MLETMAQIEAQAARRRADAESREKAGAGETAAAAGGPPKLQQPGGSSQAGQTSAELDNPRAALPLREPGPGEEQVRGLLLRIDCTDRQIMLTLKVGDRLLRLQSAGLEKIEFITFSPDVSGDITCGARRPGNPVIITYRPAKNTRPGRADGEALAVAFVPKEFLENK